MKYPEQIKGQHITLHEPVTRINNNLFISKDDKEGTIFHVVRKMPKTNNLELGCFTYKSENHYILAVYYPSEVARILASNECESILYGEE